MILATLPDKNVCFFLVGVCSLTHRVDCSKGRQASVAEFFDGGRMKQPGQQTMPMALDKAAYILGHTKPGELAEQADFLVGAAEELAGK